MFSPLTTVPCIDAHTGLNRFGISFLWKIFSKLIVFLKSNHSLKENNKFIFCLTLIQQLLCLTEINQFIIVFQSYNKMECPLKNHS